MRIKIKKELKFSKKKIKIKIKLLNKFIKKIVVTMNSVGRVLPLMYIQLIIFVFFFSLILFMLSKRIGLIYVFHQFKKYKF